jgi:endonuclease III
MSPQQMHERTRRVACMNKKLTALYPDARIELNYGSTWELLVAVILSAQCTDARVNSVTKTLFVQFRDIEAYASASQNILEQAVFQCGFYRHKARYIRMSAQMIIKDFKGTVPDCMDDLLKLPGVARKTANVVLSNAFQKHEGIAVDTHVRRFAIRFDLSDYTDPVRIERDLMAIMPHQYWWGFNHRLVLYGRYICPARKHTCGKHELTQIFPPASHIWPKAI